MNKIISEGFPLTRSLKFTDINEDGELIFEEGGYDDEEGIQQDNNFEI